MAPLPSQHSFHKFQPDWRGEQCVECFLPEGNAIHIRSEVSPTGRLRVNQPPLQYLPNPHYVYNGDTGTMVYVDPGKNEMTVTYGGISVSNDYPGPVNTFLARMGNSMGSDYPASKAVVRSQLDFWATQMAKLERFPDEPAIGTVIRFEKTFPGSDITYMYVAFRAPNGLWYVTGTKALARTDGVTYERLVEFMADHVVGDVEVVKEWEKFA